MPLITLIDKGGIKRRSPNQSDQCNTLPTVDASERTSPHLFGISRDRFSNYHTSHLNIMFVQIDPDFPPWRTRRTAVPEHNLRLYPRRPCCSTRLKPASVSWSQVAHRRRTLPPRRPHPAAPTRPTGLSPVNYGTKASCVRLHLSCIIRKLWFGLTEDDP